MAETMCDKARAALKSRALQTLREFPGVSEPRYTNELSSFFGHLESQKRAGIPLDNGFAPAQSRFHDSN